MLTILVFMPVSREFTQIKKAPTTAKSEGAFKKQSNYNATFVPILAQRERKCKWITTLTEITIE